MIVTNVRAKQESLRFVYILLSSLNMNNFSCPPVKSEHENYSFREVSVQENVNILTIIILFLRDIAEAGVLNQGLFCLQGELYQHLRRAWKPAPVFLPGESHEQRILAGYSPWRSKESDITGWMHAWRHFALLWLENYWHLTGEHRGCQ